VRPNVCAAALASLVEEKFLSLNSDRTYSRVAHVSTRPVVLLLQPERDDREMYAEFLESRGFLTVCAATTADALALVPGADVIVTAILLPGQMDGLEFVRRVRANDYTRDLPVIVLTAAAWDTERARAIDAGCDVFLAKPCLPLDLLQEVRGLLASAALSRSRERALDAKLDEAPAKRNRDARG
jgi:CheY-like chemotaxis protein